MSTCQSTATASGVGFLLLLSYLLAGLKLDGVIAWSWWLILAPLWVPAALAAAAILAIVIFALVYG